MKTIPLITLCLGVVNLSASEIRWTAHGTVSSLSGAAFSSTDVTAGNDVEIVMAYDSATEVAGRSLLFYPGGAVAGRAWFYGSVNLSITVKIGENTWTGQVPTLTNSMNVMESVCYDFGGPYDWFKVTLDSARGGTFPSYPHTGNESVRALTLEFRADSSPPNLFDVHVLPDSITNLCDMTSATGSIEAGSSLINFTINPSSVSITRPQVQASVSKISDGVQLSWETELGKSYRIEGSSNLRCWSDDGVFPGTGGTLQQNLTPFTLHTRRFYRISEL